MVKPVKKYHKKNNKNYDKKRESVNYSQPYDSKVFEKCESCEGKMFYRRRSLFNEIIYYLLCSECGDFKTISKELFLEKVSGSTNSTK